MKMQISELAKLMGISVRTLQYYDRIGLLKPAAIEENGYRTYDQESVKRLQKILHYKKLDFSLKDIGLLLSKEDASVRYALTNQRKRLAEKKRETEALLSALDNELAKPVRIKGMFDLILEKYNYSGFSYANIGEKGEEVFLSWGKADYEGDKSFTFSSKFCIRSLTTQFTAFCVLLLYEKGRIDIYRSVSEYLPEFVCGDKIKIIHLLNMTSGISIDEANGDYYEKYRLYCEKTGFEGLSHEMRIYHNHKFNSLYFSEKNGENFFSPINSLSLKHEAGECFVYSDIDYYLLGMILERVCKKPLGDIFGEFIFTPLEMTDTVFGGNDTDVFGYLENTRTESANPAYGACGIISTPEDMGKWYGAILNKRLLGQKGYDILFGKNDFGFSCGFYTDEEKPSHYSHYNQLYELNIETEIDTKEGTFYFSLRNKAPIPENKARVMFFPIRGCDDGKVKFEVWEMEPNSLVRVFSLKIYDEAAKELFRVKADETDHEKYIIDVFNSGEKRHASEFAERYYYEVDLSGICGDYNREKTYFAEISSECVGSSAQLGFVYRQGGEWISGYYNVFYHHESAYPLFLEALNNVK